MIPFSDQLQTMFKSEEARKAAEILLDQISAVKNELESLQVKCGGANQLPTAQCKNFSFFSPI